ncbi:MAG: Crp/Fnr family transcriptional regulator [Bacteroidia bacterium]|nr:Crp/Fnr family transcriptional regulator [Bacteroidia bacterium]MCZ2249570.1 Crp/Fnr family transcriptional regulator [Bacteroidia bacterium]
MNTFLQKFFNDEWQEFILFHSKILKYEANETIFKIGDKTHGIYIIKSGKVKVSTYAGNNAERIIRLATNNEMIGHRGFGGSWKYTVTAVTLENTELLFVPLKIFEMAFRANPDFAYHMMMFYAIELRESERLASQLPVKNVVASVLYNNLKTFGYAPGSKTELAYSLSRKDLASQAGTRYETLIRTLADLNNEKIIRLESKTIHILDEKKLIKLKDGVLI